MNIDDLRKLVLDKHGNLSGLVIGKSKQFINLVKPWLNEQFPNTPTKEQLWLVLNSKYIFPQCECGKLLSFVNFTQGYQEKCKNCREVDRRNKISATKLSTGEADINKANERRKSTNREKYGCDYATQSSQIRLKTEQTCIERYGETSPLKRPELKELLIANGLSNFGQSEIARENRLKTNMERYGAASNLGNKEEHRKTTSARKIKIFNETLINLSSVPNFTAEEYSAKYFKYQPFSWECKQCGTIFFHPYVNGREPRCLACYPILSGVSQVELEFADFVKSLDASFKKRKNVIAKYELDLYSETRKIAFEFNGIFWHSEAAPGHNKDHHFNKTRLCEEKGIRLFHVFEDEWIYQQEIIKGRIRTILGLNERIVGARNTKVEIISAKLANKFLNVNHIQGSGQANVHLGLFLNDELLSVMTFGKPRFNKKVEWELNRFANLINVNISGGAGKLFNYFTKMFSPKSVLSYSERRWGSGGDVYRNIGFTQQPSSLPGYSYFDKRNFTRINRLKLRHSALKEMDGYEPTLTQSENAKRLGFYRIWDCGQNIFIWERK